MKAVWKSKGKALHTRNIAVTTYLYDEQRIIVEGILKDDRFQACHTITGETLPGGVIHHMSIAMLVNVSNLSIEDVDVHLKSVPHDACLETIGCLDAIKGLTITRGFTAKAKKMAGGKKGCTHLMELLLVVAPAAFQGLITYRTLKPAVFDPDRARRFLETLTDTCHAWREDGPFVKKYKERLEMK
jgi:hypothetical protein